MSSFNSGAIDPALLSSNGSGSVMSPAQLLGNRPLPGLQNSSSQSPSTPATPNQQVPTVTIQPPSVPPHQPYLLSSGLSSSNSGPAASAHPAHLQTGYSLGLSSPANALTSTTAPSSGAPLVNGASTSITTPATNDPFHSNGMSLKEQEMHQKDQELAQFLLKMDDYKPVIPDEVTAYYLQRVGFECTDVRVQRLLGLACQKFVADIAQDAFGYARTRTSQGPGGRQGPLAPSANSANSTHGTQPGTSTRKDRTRTVLTQEDLAQALGEYGINASRAPYYL